MSTQHKKTLKTRINVESFQHDDWIKIYDGRWSFLTTSHFGDLYTKGLRFGLRPFMPQTMIFISHNRSSGWVRQKDRDILGNYLAGQVTKKPLVAKDIAKNLELQAKTFLKFIDQYENTTTTIELYEEFWQRLQTYYHVHINVKYVVDYLSPELLKKYLPILQKARLVAEPVLNRTEDFLVSFAKLLSKQTKYDNTLLLCLTKQELKEFFRKQKLPKMSELKKRFTNSVFLHNEKSAQFFVGTAVKKIEKIVHQVNKAAHIKGFIAFPGKVIGVVRIVNDPQKVKVFNVGDVLVSGATRPEFLPIMHKAAAFVTDTGGILSHASITAREMKKPCIIGTKIATKVLKDGDMVEVDAANGIVRIIKSK